jgi:hypothetical protein
MKRLTLLISLIMLFTSFALPAATLTAEAAGSMRAISISWGALHPKAVWHQVRRVKPTSEFLTPKPFAGNTFTDSKPADGSNTYEITALDSNLNQLASKQVTASTDKTKPTLSMPCNTILAFATGSKTFKDNGTEKTMTAAPTIRDGKMYLVIRYVVEPLGGTIGFDKATSKVTISALGHTVEMWIGKPMAKVDGQNRQIDPKNTKVAPFIEGGRTYVPLRFPVESLGRGAIDWFAKEKLAVLVFPLGCQETIEGQITSVGNETFTIDSDIGQVELPVPAGAKPGAGQCASVGFERLAGKTFTGSYYSIPCTECDGDTFAGIVISSAENLIIKDAAGKVQTFVKGDDVFSPPTGSCVAGCIKDGVVVSVRLSDCPTQEFEGKVLTACKDGTFGFAVGGVSLQVKVPQGYDCSNVGVGNCLVVNGNTDPTNPSVIVAKKIAKTECVTGREYTVFVQGACVAGKVQVCDIDGNAYSMLVPKGTTCDFSGGTCLKVMADVSGDIMTASKATQTQPPKDSIVYHKGFITSVEPLVFTEAGGRAYNLTMPSYFSTKPQKGAAVELWGRPVEDNLKAVRLAIVPGMAKTAEGMVLEIMCQTRIVVLKTGTSKLPVKLPFDFKCESLSPGDCLKVTGIMEGDTLHVSIVESVKCQETCDGKTYKGTIIGVDCKMQQLRVRTYENRVLTVTFGQSVKCDSLYKGVCVQVCGIETGDSIIAQTVTLIDCPLDVCEGKILEGILQSMDCKAGTFTVSTKDGETTLKIPDTVECSRLEVGSCIETCMTGEFASYVHFLNCASLGQRIEGTMISADSVQLKDGSQLKIKSSKTLSAGDCIVAIGKMSDMETDTFIANICVVIPCQDQAGGSGVVEIVDCKTGQLVVRTSTGPKEFKIPEGFDCNNLYPGDCVFVNVTGGKTSISLIGCPEFERLHVAMMVMSTSQDGFEGTDLTSLTTVKVTGKHDVKKGSLIVANGHRLSSRQMDKATIEPLVRGLSSSKPETLKLISFDSKTGVATCQDVSGNARMIIIDQANSNGFKPDDILSMKTVVWDTGFGPRCTIGTDISISNQDAFIRQILVGVIFGVDTADDMILIHTHEGDNMAVRPADLSVIGSIRSGDCVIATGTFDREQGILTNAKLDVSDCAGGEIGRSFTGILTSVDGNSRTLTVASDNSGTFEVYTEAVSQLTGLNVGDCVAISGVLLNKARPNRILSKLIQRIDCKNPANQPVMIEGAVEEYTVATKQLKVKVFSGISWTVFIEMNEIPNFTPGMTVRVAGRLQAKLNTISRAYVEKVWLPPARWSVMGKVTEAGDGKFGLQDGSGRSWIMHSSRMPEKDQTVIAAGIVPTFGLAELVNVDWMPSNGWKEAKSSFGGVVFGVSCGNDNLLVRDVDSNMTSLRLPHTGFCGFFAIGECVSANSRLQGAMPGLAKITEVKGSQSSCFDITVTGKIIGRSTAQMYSIMQTTQGRLIRLGYETEMAAGKLMIGDVAKVSGRFMPSAPDTLKVDSITKFGGAIPYETTGRIVKVSPDSIIISEPSGRLLLTDLPENSQGTNGLMTRYVSVKGQFLNGAFTANSVKVIKNPTVAIELEGEIVKRIDHTILIKDYQGGFWQIGVLEDDGAKVGDSVFVAGWSDSANWWSVSDAIVFKTSGPAPATNVMFWGEVTGKDCDTGKVTIKCDDSTLIDSYPYDKGICDTVTLGERIQVSGIMQIGMTNTINGARVARPGLSGDRKMINGIITEISCVSRVAKVKESDREGIPGSVWTVGLDKSVKCEDYKIGDNVKVTGDLVLTQKLTLEDAVFEVNGTKTVDATVKGMLVSLECESQKLIIQSEGKLFKVYLKDQSECPKFTSGDTLVVTGKSQTNRKSIITQASCERLLDNDAYTVITGRVDFAGCKDARVLVLEGNEFWTVNFADGQPCDKLLTGMVVTFKGKREQASTHLLLKAIILDTIKPKISVGTIDEIYCDRGSVTLVEEGGAIRNVWLETDVSSCIGHQYSKGDKVQVKGYLDILYPTSDIHFALIEPFGDKQGLVPMDFVAEVLDNFNCRDKGIVQVRTGHVVWRVKLPDGTDCRDMVIGNWFRFKGGMLSFKDKTMVADTIDKSRTVIIGFVNEANYSIPELNIKELKKEYRWKVQLADKNDTRNWKKGQYVVVTGDITGDMRLSNATLQGQSMAKGKIKNMNPATQSIDIDGEDLRTYKIFIKTDWIDIKEFDVGDVITAVGTRTEKDLKKEGNVMLDCYVEESSGLPPPPFVIKPNVFGRFGKNWMEAWAN